MPVEPGQNLMHYRLVDKLGEGGMGVVWKALDTKLHRHVAIKVLPARLTADDERRLRFQREAQTAAALSHPNIAVVHEVGEHEGTPFLVMELLEGRTLQEISGKQPLPVDRWLELARPIADALAHAHKNGVVHRDLKAANVMVTSEGHVKLLDFGLAKLLQPESAPEEGREVHTQLETISRELTRVGSVMGTVAYMSPEQARGETVDHRSDIFSFGVLSYELLTGDLPFSGASDIESLNATLTAEATPPSGVVADLPADVDRLVAKAMEKEPDRRYQHADDITIDLRNLERDLTTGRVVVRSGPQPKSEGSRGGRSILPWIGGAVLLVAAVWGVTQLGPSSDAPAAAAAADAPERIVVLPFENRGESEDEYFAAGVTEEIISRLAAVSDLNVISRTSAFQYDREGKTLQQIGEDFNVDHVLEGTVRWAGSGEASRVRISPQLVRVADDTSVWGDSFDAPMEDIFEVQTEIAEQVIEALGVVLLARERESMEAEPTDNPEAYRAYLRGKESLALNPESSLATQMFRRAVELDPEFSQAWTGLSMAHSWQFHAGDRSSDHCGVAKDAVNEALRLTPDSPDSHLAMGTYHYRCFRDYERAMAEIEIAHAAQPNDTEAILIKATLNKRQGNLREALRLHDSILELEPMHWNAFSEKALILEFLREYADAVETYDKMVANWPDKPDGYSQRIRALLNWKGSTEDARAILEAMPETNALRPEFARVTVDYYAKRYEDALARLANLPETFDDQETLTPRAALAAKCYEGLGQPDRAREAWESAVALLEDRRRDAPDDFRAYSDLGPALAALGREGEALAAAERAVELMPSSRDFEAAMVPAVNLALTRVRLGRLDDAFADLEELLSEPGLLSINMMKLDPVWKAVVEDPRFAELERRFGG